jgi:hypothetical protein
MKRASCVAACLLLHTCPSCAAADWRLGQPIVSYVTWDYHNGAVAAATAANIDRSYGWPGTFDPTTLTPAIAQQAKAAGFNLVWINDLEQLPIAQAYGLRAQYILSGHQPQNNLFFLPAEKWPDPANAAAIDALLDRFKASPAAYSYFLIDEPDAKRFAQLGMIVAYIRQRDPGHLVYINLLPPDADPATLGGAHDYATYLSQFIGTVHPQLLSYDSYNLFFNRDGSRADRGLFLGNLQTIAQSASHAAIPFMPIVQGGAFDSNWRNPSLDELRFLQGATLAYGAGGISFFNYWNVQGAAAGGIAPYPDGAPSSVYGALQGLNPRFRNVANVLRQLVWNGTYLKGYVPTAMPRKVLPLTRGRAFDIPALTNSRTYVDGAPLKGALLGYFGIPGSRSQQTKYALVENLDYSASHTYRVTGPGPLCVFDADADRWTHTGQSHADVTLTPGGFVLLGVLSESGASTNQSAAPAADPEPTPRSR